MSAAFHIALPAILNFSFLNKADQMRSQTFENSNSISTEHSFSAFLLLLITTSISPEVNPSTTPAQPASYSKS